MLNAPIVVRPAFTLGGGGGGFARRRGGAGRGSPRGLAASPIGQVLVERSLLGWYEIEYEVLRDASDTDDRDLRHGEPRPDGRPHRRLDRRRADPDAARPGRPAAASLRPEDRPRAGARGRLQRPAGGRAGRQRLPGDRGQPARHPLVGAGLEGDRLPDRADRGAQIALGRRLHEMPNPGHRRQQRRLRAGRRLRRRQAAALAVRQVPDRRPQHSASR